MISVNQSLKWRQNRINFVIELYPMWSVKVQYALNAILFNNIMKIVRKTPKIILSIIL